jgi:hypothetical protein
MPSLGTHTQTRRHTHTHTHTHTSLDHSHALPRFHRKTHRHRHTHTDRDTHPPTDPHTHTHTHTPAWTTPMRCRACRGRYRSPCASTSLTGPCSPAFRVQSSCTVFTYSLLLSLLTLYYCLYLLFTTVFTYSLLLSLLTLVHLHFVSRVRAGFRH